MKFWFFYFFMKLSAMIPPLLLKETQTKKQSYQILLYYARDHIFQFNFLLIQKPYKARKFSTHSC